MSTGDKKVIRAQSFYLRTLCLSCRNTIWKQTKLNELVSWSWPLSVPVHSSPGRRSDFSIWNQMCVTQLLQRLYAWKEHTFSSAVWAMNRFTWGGSAPMNQAWSFSDYDVLCVVIILRSLGICCCCFFPFWLFLILHFRFILPFSFGVIKNVFIITQSFLPPASNIYHMPGSQLTQHPS